MKYIFIFFLPFFLVNPVIAAKMVNGTVPEVRPLQPPPEGVSPNLSNNIQFNDPSHEGQFDASGTVQNIPSPQAGQPIPSQKAGQPASSVSPGSKSGYLVWWAVILAVLMFFGWLIYKRKI